jgi:hypothetical protein
MLSRPSTSFHIGYLMNSAFHMVVRRVPKARAGRHFCPARCDSDPAPRPPRSRGLDAVVPERQAEKAGTYRNPAGRSGLTPHKT